MAEAREKCMGEERLTTREATAKVVWALAHGDAVSNHQAGLLTGFTPHGAYEMLCSISRVIPIYQDAAGKWQVIAARELV